MRTERKLSVYESIIQNFKRDIALGIYGKGDRLPSCRELALQMGINPNTVQRAYTELEAQGVIYTIPKKGVYVADGQKTGPQNPDRAGFSVTDLAHDVRRAKSCGLGRADVEEILQNIVDEVFKEKDDD